MADRTAAALFGRLFKILAGRDALPDHIELWDMIRGYDFSPGQMGCSDALKALDLMWVCPDNDIHDWYVPNYGPRGESDKCDECGAPRP